MSRRYNPQKANHMKTNKIITACASLLLLASCQDVLEEKAKLDVTVLPTEQITFKGDTIVVAQGTKIDFQLNGEPDCITFYSGETGKKYDYRTRMTIDPKEILTSEFSFNLWAQYGNKACTENTMSVFVSDNFEGLLANNFEADSVAVEKHAWKELVPQSELPKAPVGSAAAALSYKVDIKSYLGKPFILAFRYKTVSNSANQPTWHFLGTTITNLCADAEVAKLAPSAFGFMAVNMFYKTSPWVAGISNAPYATVTKNTNGFWNVADVAKGDFRAVGPSTGNPLCYSWLVTKSIVTNACSPDTGLAIKNTTDRLPLYSHTYNKAGVYTATFEGNNANFEASSSVARHLIIKVVK